MELDQIEALIALMKENELAEVSVTDSDGTAVKLVARQADRGPVVVTSMHPSSEVAMGAPAAPASSPERAPGAEEAEAAEEGGATINSPIVGTFYRASSPDAGNYIEIDDEVDEDSVLCIVEAMKVMNEIKAECAGRILEILVENGQPVEFGQPLFRIQPSD